MAVPSREHLTKLERRRESIKRACESMLLEARSQGRQRLNEGEDRRWRQARADLAALDEQIVEYREDLQRVGSISERLHAATHQTTRNTTMNYSDDRDLVYRRGDPRQSWCRDLIRLSLNLDSDGESRARLTSHAQQVVDHPAFQEHRDLSRVDGSGGYAVPPAWLMSRYFELARPGRAFANLVQRQPLPGGTDSINIPKLLTGTSTAIQTGG